ncbi:MAG: AmmeMemoRadiSam system protein B [Rhodospirillales bacterium]|nr:AmmeMemoRadiSam system protein B [Rhodospirillales bacterium]MDH3918880.1 AmmeMemoRadiSam system protein B [Rhodospirillales bacterium]MDH3968216.1 AmmeMemoRadiSam system protein B [Rhodospirillales bacterium]
MLRPAAVAGSFYPEDPAVLTAVIEDFLAEADGMASERPSKRPSKAIIAPHAGYIYSGEIAARVYAAIVPWAERIKRVVLLGPAHYLPFTGIAAPAATEFETPLGSVPVDRAALNAIGGLPQVVVAEEAHAPEHSLEVQIPFLQVVLGAIEIVPLVVGRARPGEVAEVLERLWGGGETLIVVSSDLSHYLDYETARQRDAKTAAAIESLDVSGLGPEDACGYLPIAGLVQTARPRAMTVRQLDLRNSGDTAGPRDGVVGYGAWAFGEAGA